jgi:glycosyltransferase involved in cell wall biosynthesis
VHQVPCEFAGRFHPQKAIAALFCSADHVVAGDSHAKYLIVGSPDSPHAAAQSREMLSTRPKLDKSITVLDKLPRSRLALLYRVADVALIPSIYEACCYASLEAMACAVPIVATDAGCGRYSGNCAARQDGLVRSGA